MSRLQKHERVIGTREELLGCPLIVGEPQANTLLRSRTALA
jgi:hypothetical protein